MSERTLKKITALLGALVVLWLASSLLRKSGGPSVAAGGVAEALDGLDETTVASVRIEGPLTSLTLERNDGAWTVNGLPADSAAVQRLWDALSDADVGAVVATNPANHERMGVSADSAWSVRLIRSDGNDVSLLVGKTGPTYPSVYARLADRDDVVVISGDLRPAIAKGLLAWRDKTVLRTDTAAVARVVIDADGATHQLERSNGAWMVDGGVADATGAADVLRELDRLMASGFVDDGPAAEEDPIRVTALDAGGDTLSTVLFTGSGTTRHARVPGSAVVFELPSWRVERIAPGPDALRPEGDDQG